MLGKRVWEVISGSFQVECSKATSTAAFALLSRLDEQQKDRWSEAVNPMLLLLPDPFREMRAQRKTMEPQKPGNSPGPGPEVVERQSRQRVNGAKSTKLDSAE